MSASGHWDDATKSEVMRRLASPGATVAQVSRDLRLRRETVRQYAKKLQIGTVNGSMGSTHEVINRQERPIAANWGQLGPVSVCRPRQSDPEPDQFSTYEQIHGRKVAAKAANDAKWQPPEGHIVKGVSVLVDEDGNERLRWIKTREDLSVADIVETIREAFKEYEGRAQATPAPAISDTDLLNLFPLADWHVGLFSWKEETGVNWDLKIAEATIGQGIDDLVDRSPAAANAIVLGGGDLLHADNQENRTARSGNALDVDGRYQKVLMTACRLVVRTVDACLRKHKHVTVRILPGNHDEHSSVAVAYFLLAWYRDEPRVTVDVDASLFFWFRFGKVMLGATHGHSTKAKDMPMVMAHRRAEDWGATKFRYVHTFHLHHDSQTMTEGGGCIREVHRTPTPQDAWHYGSGFISGRSLKSITYHREYGEVSRSTLAIIDAKLDNAA